MSLQNPNLYSKFEATLLGSLVGDCVGRRFEGIWGPNLTDMIEEFQQLKEKSENDEIKFDSKNLSESYIKPFTDDTALTRAICESFLSKKDFDLEDMANSFQSTYMKEPNRGYASGAIFLLKSLNKLKNKNELCDKCFMPAMELFDGEGSYGNGGAMRCSPIALFTCYKPEYEMRLICELITKLTHTHIRGVIGALQQSYAVRLALQNNSPPDLFDFDNYYEKIIRFVSDIEKTYYLSDLLIYQNLSSLSENMQKNFLLYLQQKIQMLKHKNRLILTNLATNLREEIEEYLRLLQLNEYLNKEPDETYSTLLRKMHKLIKKCRNGEKINLPRLYERVANCGVSSIQSIPMALFAFMVASDPKCAYEVNNKLKSKDAFKQFNAIERVIFYAISFGGDTDTISSMAGAIAGAFFGKSELPKYLIEMCESHAEAQKYAERLYELSVPYEISSIEEDSKQSTHLIESNSNSYSNNNYITKNINNNNKNQTIPIPFIQATSTPISSVAQF